MYIKYLIFERGFIMEIEKINHYKKLIKGNLKRNLPKYITGVKDTDTIAYNMTDKINYYMKHYTNDFDPSGYTVTATDLGNGTKFINVSFKSGDITRRLIFLENGELFGVKHFNKTRPGSFSYGLPDKSVNNINSKFHLG